PTVFTQMQGDEVCAGLFRAARCLDGIGIRRTALLTQGGDVIDIHAKFYHDKHSKTPIMGFLALFSSPGIGRHGRASPPPALSPLIVPQHAPCRARFRGLPRQFRRKCSPASPHPALYRVPPGSEATPCPPAGRPAARCTDSLRRFAPAGSCPR